MREKTVRACLPVFFEVDYRRARTSKFLRIRRLTHVDVEIPEVSLSRMDLLATWNTANRYTLRYADGQAMTCARWNGDLYVPLTQWSGKKGEHFVSAGVLRDTMSGADRAYVPMAEYGPVYYLADGDGENARLRYYLRGDRSGSEPLEGGTVGVSDESERAADVRAMAERLLVVDGTVWHRVSGLHLKIQTATKFGTGGRPETYVDIDYLVHPRKHLKRLENGPLSSAYKLALGEIEKASAFSGKKPMHMFSDLVVHDPAPFDYDGLAGYLAPVMRSLADGLESRIGDLPSDLVPSWLTLRTEAARLESASRETVSPEALGALGAMLSAGIMKPVETDAVARGLAVYAALNT